MDSNCWLRAYGIILLNEITNTPSHTHTHIYIYIYMPDCVRVWVRACECVIMCVYLCVGVCAILIIISNNSIFTTITATSGGSFDWQSHKVTEVNFD